MCWVSSNLGSPPHSKINVFDKADFNIKLANIFKIAAAVQTSKKNRQVSSVPMRYAPR